MINAQMVNHNYTMASYKRLLGNYFISFHSVREETRENPIPFAGYSKFDDAFVTHGL